MLLDTVSLSRLEYRHLKRVAMLSCGATHGLNETQKGTKSRNIEWNVFLKVSRNVKVVGIRRLLVTKPSVERAAC